MEENILSKLKEAQSIIQEAFTHYDNADEIDQKFQQMKKKSNYKVIAIAVAAICIFLLTQDAHFLIKWLLHIITFGGAAVLLYALHQSKVTETKDYLDQIKAENKLGNDLIDANREKLEFLQDDYWYPTAINYIVKIMESGRADDLNQALSMYDEQLHRWKVEESNNEIKAELTRQSRIMSDIEANTAADTTIGLMDFINRL